MKKSLLLFSLCLIITSAACNKKNKDELENTLGNPNDQGEAAATTTTTLPAPVDGLKDIVEKVAPEVDKYHGGNEFAISRGSGSIHSTDSCEPALKDKKTFADQVAFYVYKNMEARVQKLNYIASIYNLPAEDTMYPTSLMSHAMCDVSEETLKLTLGESKVPSSAVIQKASDWVKKYNHLRTELMNHKDNPALIAEMAKFWARLNMCLSYTVSLKEADQKKSDEVAALYAPAGYRRPAGILFHERSAGIGINPERLIEGLFQFTPIASGNIQACLQQWNNLYPQCQVSLTASSDELVRILGSSYQSFNSFCGTEKPLESFAVQVNTLSSNRTHPSNMTARGLKDPAQRCVSLYFAAGTAYNHFGPFQNSTGANLEDLLNCAVTQ